ncbi:MAG: hypothetical protein K6T94_22520 [Paenibacillus sp.]|nr:hypothetical protein [Paenibacillus sp.]
MIRAKFLCVEKGEVAYSLNATPSVKIVMQPVYGTSEENKAFFQATPSGKLELCTVNPKAAAEFEVGKSYYIDFSPAE